jgi:hypothetical protein
MVQADKESLDTYDQDEQGGPEHQGQRKGTGIEDMDIPLGNDQDQ